MIGTTVSHYRILEKLGEGGMGEVYRARDNRLDREVAFKVLPREVATKPELLQRFRREAKALAALDYPNIVTVHSVEEADGIHFITMGLVEGKPLDRLIPDGGLDLETFFELAIPLADALAVAHGKGITHRDLKPANVMVADEDRLLKILDFGLAKFQSRSDEPEEAMVTLTAKTELTQHGAIMGTVPYMSPEQVEAKPLDHRTDIFSLGVILYEMLTGERPFKGDSMAGLTSAILRDAPPPLAESRIELPRHLERIVSRCLEKNPKARFQTARDVCNELEGLEKELDSTVPGPSSGKSSAVTEGQATENLDVEEIRRVVRRPAIGLIVTGILNWIGFPAALVTLTLLDYEIGSFAKTTVTLGALLFSSVIILGGLSLMHLRSRRLVITGSVLAMIITPGNIVGLPIAIWTLWTLTRDEVDEAFRGGGSGAD